MLAFLVTLGLFLFLAMLGRATLEVLGVRESILRKWLLAPSVGLAIVVLLVLNLNQVGLPVKSFASWLTLGLALFSGAIFWRRRSIIPWKPLSLFGAIALFSIVYTCWPMFLYGFRWVGYMNGDMGTYCLGALRAMNYGFYRIPTAAELMGKDYSQYWWFHYAVGLFRCGTDLFLAWSASVLHLQPMQVTMSVLGALNAAQLFTAAALAIGGLAPRRVAMIGSCVLAVSPFFILGVMTQVGPQIGGITLLLALCALCMPPASLSLGASRLLRRAAAIAIIGSALSIYYPEALPFGVLAILAFHAYQLIRRRETIRSMALLGLAALVILFVSARQTVFTAIGTILFTLAAGVKSGGAVVPVSDFDTMLDPSLFASVFGMQPYYGVRVDPWISIAIAIGIALLAACALVCVRCCFRGYPPAFLLLVMLTLAVQLFFSHSAFALFKLAMYVQPVLAFALAVLARRFSVKKVVLFLSLYLAATFYTTSDYVLRSTDLVVSTSISLPDIVQNDIQLPALSHGEGLLMDSPNMVGDYIFASRSIGTDTQWADMDVFEVFAETYLLPLRILPLPPKFGLMKNYLTTAQFLRHKVSFGGRTDAILGHSVPYRHPYPADVTYFGHLMHDPWHLSNNRDSIILKRQYFSYTKISEVKNHLVLLSSDKGGPHYRSYTVSRWPAESDSYRPGGTFYAVGRHLLFEVIGPTPNARLRISLSRTLVGAGRTALPGSAVVRGAETESLPFVGNGSANIFSGPIRPLELRHRFYVALDLGIDGDLFPNRKTGLMHLFNVQIAEDPRKVVGYARDISIVRDEDYAKMIRPVAVTRWPADLLNVGLEYSGIYEDGWMGDRGYLVLGRNDAAGKLIIRGQVPAIDGLDRVGNDLTVRLNGLPVYRSHLKTGQFDIEQTLNMASAQNRIEFVFTRIGRLPRGDDRPVAARLLQVKISGSH